MHLITPAQCRAARALLNWSQPDLAKRCGIHVQTISNFEIDKGFPAHKTLRIIRQALESGGVELSSNGGVYPVHHTVQILEGQDAYIQLLNDALWNIGADKQLLKSSVDERKSPQEVIDKNKELREAGIRMRVLVEEGNTYLMGRLIEYRHMPPALFGGDVKLIYGDRVAYSMPWVDIPKVIIIHDKVIAAEQRKLFEYVWEKSIPATKTTAKMRYEEGAT